MNEEMEFSCQACGEGIEETDEYCGPCLSEETENNYGDMLRAIERDEA